MNDRDWLRIEAVDNGWIVWVRQNGHTRAKTYVFQDAGEMGGFIAEQAE